MKKILFGLMLLCFASPAFAKQPVTGSGWETVCTQKVTVKRIGKYKTSTYGVVCKKQPTFNVIGLRLDAGVPDLLGASLIGRPLRFLQVEAGGTTTLVGGGVRVGASIFLPWYVSPSAHFEYGHQWAGNVNKLVTMFGGSDPKISVLNSVEYDYLNFHGGLGFGHPNWFMFRILAGYSYIWGSTNGLQAYVQARTNQPNLTLSEATAHVWTPSAKLLFDLYF